MSKALVTGASSGVGREMAIRLSRQGHDVVLVARNREELTKLADTLTNASVVVADLATDEGVARVASELGDVDILINNAGFGALGDVATLSAKTMHDMIDVNCVAVTELTRACLPGMLERGRGNIVNVASTAAFQPGPGMATYYASKAYVLSFTEALAEEVRGSGVKITAFCPGAFESGFFSTAKAENSRLAKMMKLPTSSHMADAALSAMAKGRVVAIPGVTNKIGVVSARWAPKALTRRIVHFIQGEA